MSSVGICLDVVAEITGRATVLGAAAAAADSTKSAATTATNWDTSHVIAPPNRPCGISPRLPRPAKNIYSRARTRLGGHVAVCIVVKYERRRHVFFDTMFLMLMPCFFVDLTISSSSRPVVR